MLQRASQALRTKYSIPAVFFASAAHSMASSAVQGIRYDAPGEPLDVLRLTDLPQEELKPGFIRIKMLLAPINPSDVNTCQGKYPIQPKLPGTPGHEGVGVVTEVGIEVQGFTVGDHVIPLEPAQGTWRQSACLPASAWHVVRKEVPIDQAATLCINPPTALAMLEDFVKLQPGDVVVQNGGTSAVGKLVAQIARVKGYKTVSVIRNRPNMEETVAHLKSLGADLVTTDDKLKEDLKAAKLGPPPRLGLNCVGGASALAVCKVLAEGGTLVTYGGMSMQPVTVPTSLLIFKDLTFRGFWLSGRFARDQSTEARKQMLDTLADMIVDKKLHTDTVTYPLKDWRQAMEAAAQGYRGGKVVMDLQQGSTKLSDMPRPKSSL